jgi:hypothetical protein
MQAAGLSDRLTSLTMDGRRLNDDSKHSEKNMNMAMVEVIQYATERALSTFGSMPKTKVKITHKTKLSLYECQMFLHAIGGPEPNELNKKVCMKPDGGIISLVINDKDYPILVVEDKVQGTNDLLFKQNKPRQATGNAIERGAKNIRGAEMLFSGINIFPYVLFASGCDFHSSETIAKRIEMMNMGFPNHYIEVAESKSEDDYNAEVDALLSKINIQKRYGSIASVFVKAHKYDKMIHGSSMWKTKDIVKICCKVVDLAIDEIAKVVGASD